MPAPRVDCVICIRLKINNLLWTRPFNPIVSKFDTAANPPGKVASRDFTADSRLGTCSLK